MSKTVPFRMPAAKSQAADAWVGEGVEPHLKLTEIEQAVAAPAPIAMKRFTIDVPVELHARAKMICAQRGKFMADEIRRLLEAEFPATS
ncbi:plasmid segregation centromere-binding protein ParG [Nitrobacter hamburgensis X14]|jgi:hypothetical protein|uniref:Plasmid segregation centromere-binding protein ParG n=1 Tax=Nitrobacter hamburgensis (strain DSM 10229 / NCIMB 13809 / X14) TaxID=323097 RepID=Q1QGT2_NITHX|nr:hypothetical protein [Nitrobacter hamburgensis]ABE64565.1 plasmid segregation centromere-binding protein ParG [Nitrobacter hamburgensis X14]